MRYLLFAALLLTFASCTKDKQEEPMVNEFNIWDGPTIEFTKEAEVDPMVEANQDRITSSVWITRGNDGGQIFNIAEEAEYNKQNSPTGTRWAVGELSEVESLTFNSLRGTLENPKDHVGTNLVMHIVEEDVYLSVKFTRWDQNKAGGFTYERSTEN